MKAASSTVAVLDEACWWIHEALRLDEENRELRRMMTTLVFRIAERDELLAYADELIEERWP